MPSHVHVGSCMSWLVLSIVLGSPLALASGDAEEAEVTFQLGARAYGAGDYEQALAYFLASNRLAPNPSVAFNIARCYARTEHYAEAYRWFTLAGAGLTSANVQRAVQDELASITPKVVVYDLQSDPPGATVYADRKELGAIGVTPLKIALTQSSTPRSFIFDKEGFQESVVEGVGGTRGQSVEVKGSLRQVVGTIDIHAPEGTKVHQGAPDGPVVCDAPCEAKLAPGNWVLYFRKDGYRDAVRQLEVAAEQTVTTLVELTPNTGSVVVDASERGALIEVDGEAVGFTPTVVQAVAVGERTVRVSRPGYEPIERRILVETDKQVVLDDLELLPLDEVTAVSRRAERIELAPSSVTVIGQEELKAFQYPTIYEALRGVRGFALGYDSIYGSAAVRGLGQANDYNTRLLVLQDGAVLNDAILAQAFISYDGRVDLGGIERIEIVRGPGSVLYGTGAVSGVVNLVTESRENPEGTEVAVGTYDNHVMRARAQTHYNLTEDIGFRAAVSGAGSQGRVETIDPKGPSNPPIAVDNFDQFVGATTHGRIWLGDATVQWYHSWRDITIPTGVYFTTFDDPTHVWSDARSMAELRYEPQLSESFRLLSRAYFNRYYYDGLLPYGSFNSYEEYLVLSGGAEARFVAEAGEAFRLTVGGLVESSPVLRLDGEDQNLKGESIGTYLEADYPYQVFAGYALVDLVPIDAIRLTAGGRLDYWSATESLAFSPRLALVLVPDEGDIIKIMGGQAFRAPSIYEVAYDTPFQAGAQNINPETVLSGEAEYSHVFGSSWTGLVAAHGSLAQNIVETVGAGDVGIPVGPGTDYLRGAVTYVNSDAPIRILGADAELRRAFQGGWMLSAFYSFLDSRYESGPYEGELVTNVPQNNAGMKLIVPISAPVARIAFRSALEAPRRLSLARDTYTDPAVVSDVVLSGTVPERGFEYAVGVYNLFNMAYSQPSGDTYPLTTIPQQGRSLMANFSMRF
jgi:outer membrane receptor for ferrienterochelin and colicins